MAFPEINHSWLRNRPRLILFILLAGLHFSPAADSESWDVITQFENNLFPSVIVATSTFQPDPEDDDPTVLGDQMGQIGAVVEAPEDDAKVKVEISSQKLIEPSVFEGTLPKGGEIYSIFPVLNYDYDSLLKVRQPFPESVTIRVRINGQPAGQRQKRMLARSVNDCPFGIANDDGEYTPLDILFAAYVNENHPFVDELLGEALDAGDTESFAGYQGTHDDVLNEMRAVWNAIKARGFAYSSITRPSVNSGNVYTQHVRLIGDSIKTAQANCVDGSVLFASVFQKLGLDPFLVSIPGHMFLGVYLDKDHSDFACIETTMLSSSTFEDAVKTGNSTFQKHHEELTSEDSNDPNFALIDITEARKIGILPLREPSAE